MRLFTTLLEISLLGIFGRFAIVSATFSETTLSTKTKEFKSLPYVKLEQNNFHKPDLKSTSSMSAKPTLFINQDTTAIGGTEELVTTKQQKTEIDIGTIVTVQLADSTIVSHVPDVDVSSIVQAFEKIDNNKVNKNFILLIIVFVILMFCIFAILFYCLTKKIKQSSTYEIPKQSLNKSDLVGNIDMAGPLIPVLNTDVEKNSTEIQAIEFDSGTPNGTRKLNVIKKNNTDEAVNRLVGNHLVIDAHLNEVYEIDNGTVEQS